MQTPLRGGELAYTVESTHPRSIKKPSLRKVTLGSVELLEHLLTIPSKVTPILQPTINLELRTVFQIYLSGLLPLLVANELTSRFLSQSPNLYSPSLLIRPHLATLLLIHLATLLIFLLLLIVHINDHAAVVKTRKVLRAQVPVLLLIVVLVVEGSEKRTRRK